MKTIGIIAAMEEEISHVKTVMDIKAAKIVATMEFYVGMLKGKSVVAVKCGIGKVNAAVCTQILIDYFGVDFVINIGTAGAICAELDVGDIIISSDACHHDFDVTAFGHKPCVIPRMDESFFKADDNLVKIASQCAEDIAGNKKVFVARIASGDQFISAQSSKNKIWTDTKAYCAEMEGAAIAQTCFLNDLPFVIVREVSDNADDKAHISFDEFIKIYMKDYGELIEQLVEKI